MRIQLTAKMRRRLQVITYIFLVLTILAIIGTLVAWVLSEPGSFEPLNALFFAIFPVLTAVMAWLSRADHVAVPDNITIAEKETPALAPLRHQIANSFSLDELNALCLDLGIRYEDLSGSTVTGKSTSLVAFMQRRGQLSQLMAALQAERSNINWPQPRQLEQQYALRRNVSAAWIEGVLHQSITEEIALELKLTYHPEALTRKVSYIPGQKRQPVDKSTFDLFVDFGSLLILGEPGSGKTMTMLQLAESLMTVAESDPAKPTPVVLNLSSWAAQQMPLMDWLVEELLLQYQLPRRIGGNLILGGDLIYLLDGLDEVVAKAREACVAAINEFKAQQPAPLVVCCRIAEYEALTNRLNLGTAVLIQPLSEKQVNEYLGHPELKLSAVRQMMHTDVALKELAQTPLFLSVMTLAYRGISKAKLKRLITPSARRSHIYHYYVTEMWQRRPLVSDERYDEKQAMIWLTSIAHGMIQHEQTTFYIERLQPTWLPTPALPPNSIPHAYSRITSTFEWRPEIGVHRHYVMVNGMLWGLIVGAFGGLIVGLSIGLIVGQRLGMSIGLRVGLVVGLIMALIGGLGVGFSDWIIAAKYPINLYEELVWHLPSFRKLFKSLIDGIYGGLLLGLSIGGSLATIVGIVVALNIGLVGLNAWSSVLVRVFLSIWLSVGLSGGLIRGVQDCIQVRDSGRPPHPNLGIRNSGRNALRMALLYALVCGSIGGLIFSLFGRMITWTNIGLLGGLSIGLIFGMRKYGAITFIQHYTLRWFLAREEVLPFQNDGQFIAFMNTMKDRILLRQVGGGWVFIHRTFLEYIASLHPGVNLFIRNYRGDELTAKDAD